jgi:hypothetical protein
MHGGETEAAVWTCLPCGLQPEGFDDGACRNPIELLACPEHSEEKGIR